MKQHLLTLALLVGSLISMYAQQHHPYCGHNIGLEYMEAKHPGYLRAVNHAFDVAKSRSNASRNGQVYTINVVFHVVWKEDEENIPMEKIQEQLDELNRAFRRTNPDTVNLRTEFHPVAADPMIEFRLADIKRVKTDKLFEPTLFSLPDEVKKSSSGGSDAADPYRYLNVWICKMQPIKIFLQESPLLGYAYPPDSLAHWPAGSSAPEPGFQGVVLDYRTVGIQTWDIQGIGTLNIQGRTAVHEIGHYLGLRHISGDGNAFGGIDCNASDGVDDTPAQGAQSEFNCNDDQNTCGAGDAGDLPDMIENYMDYSSEACQNTFTKGQIAIMHAVLNGPRKGLIDPISSTLTPAKAVVEIMPNPVNSQLHIVSNEPEQIHRIALFNALGVLQSQFSGSVKSIDLSQYPSGQYWMVVAQKNGSSETHSIVKD